MKVTFIKKVQETADVVTFYFAPERPLKYIAGQFIEIYIPHKDKDSRGDKRWFTLSSAPSQEYLSITTRFFPSPSSFKQALRNLQAGEQIFMSSPMGDFVLPKDASIPLIFIAGGIGCTPFHSIIKETQTLGDKRDITLLYSVRHKEEVVFNETFSKLGKKFHIIETNGLSTKRLTAQDAIELTKPTPNHYIYISGPEPMVEILEKDIKKQGINKRHVFTDFFLNYDAN